MEQKEKPRFMGLAMEPRGEAGCNLARPALQTQNEGIIWAGSYIASILWRQSAQAVEGVSSCCGGEARQSVRFGRCRRAPVLPTGVRRTRRQGEGQAAYVSSVGSVGSASSK